MWFSILCTRKHNLWKYKLIDCIKAIKNHFKIMFTTARMLASVWHQSGIFKLVHWWCTLCIVYIELCRFGAAVIVSLTVHHSAIGCDMWQIKAFKGEHRMFHPKGSPQNCGGKTDIQKFQSLTLVWIRITLPQLCWRKSLVFPRESSCPTKGQGWNILNLRVRITCICIVFFRWSK